MIFVDTLIGNNQENEKEMMKKNNKEGNDFLEIANLVSNFNFYKRN